MNFNEAMAAVAAGKRIRRPEMGDVFFDGEELDDYGLTRHDFLATDWEVKPSDLTVTEEMLVRAWNASLPDGAPEANRAPNSGRFKRFMEALRG